MNPRTLRFANELVGEMKWLYTYQLPALYSTLVNSLRCPNNQETIEAMQEALMENFFGGCEPEWASMEACDWWFNMTPEYFDVSVTRTYESFGTTYSDRNCKFLVAPPARLTA